MNRKGTVREVMTRAFVGVTESDPVAGAAALMREENAESAVVLHGRDPIGMLQATDLIDLVAETADPTTTSVRDIMTQVAGAIPAESDLEMAMTELAEHEGATLPVIENNDIVGVLTPQDIITALTMRPMATEHPLAASGRSNEAIDAARRTDDEFATQSVCEGCGSLADTLTDLNGQLVCPDCIEIEL